MTPHVTSPALAALRARFAELFGNPPPRGMRAAILTAAIAWKEQVLVHGDIEPALARDLAIIARECRERRLAEKARAAKPEVAETVTGTSEAPAAATATASAISPPPPVPPPLPPASAQLRVGTKLVRTYAGITHVVEVIRSKRHERMTGVHRGGATLTRGSIYRILANPLFAGDIGHCGKRNPG